MSSFYKKIQKRIQKRLKKENQELFFIRLKGTDKFIHYIGTDLKNDEPVYEIISGHVPAALWSKQNAYNFIEAMTDDYIATSIGDMELVSFNDKSLPKVSSDEVCYIRKRGTNTFAHYSGVDSRGEKMYDFLEGFENARIWNLYHAKEQLSKTDVNNNYEIITAQRAVKDSEELAKSNSHEKNN